jgi:hypothetical protein
MEEGPLDRVTDGFRPPQQFTHQPVHTRESNRVTKTLLPERGWCTDPLRWVTSPFEVL